MKIVKYSDIVAAIAKACVDANTTLPKESEEFYHVALQNESDSRAQAVLKQCIRNMEEAKTKSMPLCQDTGTALFFVRIGKDVQIVEGVSPLVKDAITDGVRQGYGEGYLRKSIVADPLFGRVNTCDNTPAIIHVDVVEEDLLEIEYAPKGGGAENMSRLAMMPPSAGVEGVLDFVVETVTLAGGNPCPPIVIGIGVGGNFETCALLAKKALFKEGANSNSDYANLEKQILDAVNGTGVGPQGFGGDSTAFAVYIESAPCHIASLPVAVNINCHVHRHAKISF